MMMSMVIAFVRELSAELRARADAYDHEIRDAIDRGDELARDFASDRKSSLHELANAIDATAKRTLLRG
jgi:hypothetical protein